jgi:hypothetical protein
LLLHTKAPQPYTLFFKIEKTVKNVKTTVDESSKACILLVMNVRIGKLEVTGVTPEELDVLVKRYGGAAPETPPKKLEEKYFDTMQEAGAAIGAADTVLLKKFVDAGSTGLTTIEVGDILGKRGKAARPAVRHWALRIGLTQDDTLEVCEDARVGTQRGLRIKASLLDVARHIMGQGH